MIVKSTRVNDFVVVPDLVYTAFMSVASSAAPCEDGVLQIRPAWVWQHRGAHQQAKIIVMRIVSSEDEHLDHIRKALNLFGIMFTQELHGNYQAFSLFGPFDKLEGLRIELSNFGIRLPLMPEEGTFQLSVAPIADFSSNLFDGSSFIVYVKTPEFFAFLRMQLEIPPGVEISDDLHQISKTLASRLGTAVYEADWETTQKHPFPACKTVTFIIDKNAEFLHQHPWVVDLNTPAGPTSVRIAYCAMRIPVDRPVTLNPILFETMGDVHNSMVGRYNSMPGSKDTVQLGIKPTDDPESVRRCNQVVARRLFLDNDQVMMYVIEDGVFAVAIGKFLATNDIIGAFREILNCRASSWKSLCGDYSTDDAVLPTDLKAVSDLLTQLTETGPIWLHIRTQGTSPYRFPKLAVPKQGKCSLSHKETFILLPWQELDLLIAFPSVAASRLFFTGHPDAGRVVAYCVPRSKLPVLPASKSYSASQPS